jgi:endonuclease/exonuclease/phosphatase family metal-dependent hydrolase
MKRAWLSWCCASVILLASAGPSAAAAVARAGAGELALKVMTYNLRYASDAGPNAWPERRPMMKRLILREAPDIFGTQEGLYPQLKDLASDLPDYEWIGLGRDGGSRGEFMAVFFKRARFEPIAFDHFWLSDTPEVIGSTTWGNTNRRMVTWVRLRERATSREFSVWNTHLDHQVEEARQKAAALIRDRLADTDKTLPLILLGDFNCPAGTSRAFDILTKEAGLSDAWSAAVRRVHEEIGTFNNFKGPTKGGDRIDWVLTRGAVAVSRAEIITYTEKDRYPSDHFPVVVELVFGS